MVEGFEDGVVAGGDEGGHGERGADLGAAAADAALTPELTAVVVEGGDAGEGGGFPRLWFVSSAHSLSTS